VPKPIDLEGLMVKAVNAVLQAPVVVNGGEQFLQFRQPLLDIAKKSNAHLLLCEAFEPD
jgi:hypothetical protein